MQIINEESSRNRLFSPLFLISFILYHFGRSPVTPSAQRMKRMRGTDYEGDGKVNRMQDFIMT